MPPSAAPWNKAYKGTVFGAHWGLNIVVMRSTRPISVPMMAKATTSNTKVRDPAVNKINRLMIVRFTVPSMVITSSNVRWTPKTGQVAKLQSGS